MNLTQITIITSLCIVAVNSYFIRKSNGKRDLDNSRQQFRASTRKSKAQEITVDFCNTMHASKFEPSISPKGDGAVLPWWYRPCNKLLKEEHVQKLKESFKPIQKFIAKMKTKKYQKEMQSYFDFMTKNIEAYNKKSKIV